MVGMMVLGAQRGPLGSRKRLLIAFVCAVVWSQRDMTGEVEEVGDHP